jgi:hypothetical protein
MQTHSTTNRQSIIPENHSTHGVKPFPALTLELEVLEERIAPAYLGYRPASPCCGTR